MPTSLRRRVLAVGLIFLISGSAWIFVPHGLNLKPSHKTATTISATTQATSSRVEEGTHFIFDPKYSFTEYLVQTPQGFGVFFISTSSVPVQAALGLVILATALFFVLRKPETQLETRHRVILGFALLLVLGHFAIFNLVWLDTVFGDRFAWYFALMTVPIFFFRFRQNRLIIAFMLLATIGVSGWRLGKLVAQGAVPVLTPVGNQAPIGAIHPEYLLTYNPHPVVPTGSILIEPPVYPWATTASGSPPPHVHETVILVHPEANRL